MNILEDLLEEYPEKKKAYSSEISTIWFLYRMLEAEATKDQVNAIHDLMKSVYDDIEAGKEVSYADFEKRIYQIFPEKIGNYHLVEDILSLLKDKSPQYKLVYDHLKREL